MKQLNYQTMKFTNILISTIAVALLMCSCGKDNYPEALGGYFLGTGEPEEEKPFEYQAVDMGLDVKWADCNVGAQKPWEPGQYFAWGEIQQKQNYSWTTYKFAEGSEKTQTKYCDNAKYGKVDNKHYLLSEDDAATVLMGDGWRMPTNAEMGQLLNNCDWSIDYKNDIKIIVATSKINGATLTFALGGYMNDGKLVDSGAGGFYWLSEIETNRPCSARYLCLDTDESKVYTDSGYKFYGINIRAVR